MTAASLTIGSSAGSRFCFKQAYYYQYTSLILIILTFVIGAFLIGPQEAPEIITGNMPIVVESPSGVLEYTDLFEGGEINQDTLSALTAVLLSHDLRADIRVYADAFQEEKNIGESLVLFKKLVTAGVPAVALRVYAVGDFGQNGVQTRVEFYAQTAESSVAGGGVS